jgi:hypothetical protein
MILDVMNVDKFCRVNALPKVTSNLYVNENKQPDPEGLFSTELFGAPGSKERRMRMAYIELDGKYLHPQVFTTLCRVDTKITDMISGTKYFKYDPAIKYFVVANDDEDEDDPNVGTGLEFLYTYWDQLAFRKSNSRIRENRLELLALLKRDECFIDKQLVIPAFYRDAHISSSKMEVPKINGLYKRIMSAVAVINTLGKSNFTYNLSRSGIQNTINEIFDEFTNLIRLKAGFLRSAVMSKSIDYGVRTVITAPTFNANRWQDMPADYEHTATPLAQCIAEFTIGISAWITTWADSLVQNRTNMYIYDMTEKKVVLKTLDPNWRDDFLEDTIGKRIYRFIMTPESRFYPVTIKFEDGSYKPFMFINGNRDLILNTGEIDTESLKDVRYYTWTDVFFLAAMEVASEKALCTTRYPVTDHHSEYFSKIKVRSTFKTMRMLIGNTQYDNYPVVDLSTPAEEIESLFIDSLELFPPYIGPLGADHDGDQCSSRGLYSYEANKWVEGYISSATNAIGTGGKSIRKSGDVGDHTLYNLLRDPEI